MGNCGTIYLYVLFFCVKVSTLTILYICRWYEFYVLGFIVCFVHVGLFAHLPLQPPFLNPYCDFYVMIMWTYQMKEQVLMKRASFELICSFRWGFLLYAKGNNRVHFLRWLLGGAVSPELLVDLKEEPSHKGESLVCLFKLFTRRASINDGSLCQVN